MNLYKSTLRSFLSEFASSLRKSRGMTQEEMAEKLRITGRAYSDLERGIYCFSTVALIFLLLTLRGQDGDEQIAAVSEGLLKMENGEALLLVDTIERPEEIDLRRAEEMAAASRAELDARRSEQEQALARARIARAVSRMHVKRDGK